MWLMTAGPTREYLDEVRFLSNGSTGRMGYALAAEAARRGHEVVVVSGPVSVEVPPGVEVLPVESAREMLDAARLVLEVRNCSVLLGLAAVCDSRPVQRNEGKPAKAKGNWFLEMCENPDVIASLASLGVATVSVGFALEDLGEGPRGLRDAMQRARGKL